MNEKILKIERRISILNQEASRALLGIGKLLKQARAEFQTGKEFLGWAEQAFGYKKAFVYRLMQVAEAFADKPEFKGVAFRILSAVMGLPEELQDRATELASESKLDAKAVQALQEEARAETQEAPLVTTALQEAPEPPEVTGQGLSIADELNARIHALQAELALLKEQAKAKQQLPMLTQFKQQDLALRLGLNSKQAKDSKQIKEAFRTWVKLGYGKQHEAFNLIEEAKESLLKLI